MFGPVWGASGVQGFFGEGYWYQKLFAKIFPGYSFSGLTFVSKTATAFTTTGNMPLAEDGITPRDKRPACITIGFWQILWGVMLNAVGLSNIGLMSLGAMNRWQRRTQSFMISVMAIGKTREDREFEIRAIIKTLLVLIRDMKTRIAIQLNVSCPNTKHIVSRNEFVEETLFLLDLLSELGIPIIVKINLQTEVVEAEIIAKHPACSGISISNTIPWASVPTWMKYLFFGSTTSPLAHLGGGGLSGWPLLPRVCTWIRAARAAGITKHINAGGGIFGPFGVWRAKRAGADSISLCSIAAVRPWMLGLTARFAHHLYAPRNAPTRRTVWQ
ncbi:MAG: hypothetical protein WA058_01675 [Minisyncoccia bacterium]